MTRVEIAMALAPSFREKFDFSDWRPSDANKPQFEQWMEISLHAADFFAKELSEEEKAHKIALAKIAALEKTVEALKQTETKA